METIIQHVIQSVEIKIFLFYYISIHSTTSETTVDWGLYFSQIYKLEDFSSKSIWRVFTDKKGDLVRLLYRSHAYK